MYAVDVLALMHIALGSTMYVVSTSVLPSSDMFLGSDTFTTTK